MFTDQLSVLPAQPQLHTQHHGNQQQPSQTTIKLITLLPNLHTTLWKLESSITWKSIMLIRLVLEDSHCLFKYQTLTQLLKNGSFMKFIHSLQTQQLILKSFPSHLKALHQEILLSRLIKLTRLLYQFL